MSNLQASIEVANQLIKRLFDQKQFTTGEINYICKEVGDKCNLEDNFDRVLKLNEKTCLVSDTINSNLCNLSHKIALDIDSEVSALQERAERILKLDLDYRERERRSPSTLSSLSTVNVPTSKGEAT